MDWILCLIAGALAGSLVSMTGSGAGFLLVPGLSLALSFNAFPSADLFKIAVATTHGANLITNLAAFQAHAVRRSIDWDAFIRLGPGSIAGAAAGALLATHLDTAILELVFIAFAVALSARLLRRHRKMRPERQAAACRVGHAKHRDGRAGRAHRRRRCPASFSERISPGPQGRWDDGGWVSHHEHSRGSHLLRVFSAARALRVRLLSGRSSCPACLRRASLRLWRRPSGRGCRTPCRLSFAGAPFRRCSCSSSRISGETRIADRAGLALGE